MCCRTQSIARIGLVVATGTGTAYADTPATPSDAATRGHVVVNATGDSPLRVLIDGVDVGATPWEGDVAPGQHDIAGRSSASTAAPQSVRVEARGRVAVELISSATAGHLQVRTSDGKGVIFVDGEAKGEGAYVGELGPGAHQVVVSRDGFKPFAKTLTLGPSDTWAETVTLEPLGATGGDSLRAERSAEGLYGGFGLAFLSSAGGLGDELETNCSTLGASSCDTPSPLGGAAFGYVGYTWAPVGFEIFVGGLYGESHQTAHFDGKGASSGALPFASPEREERFRFYRGGGLAAVRVRASVQGSAFRATVAAGLGISYEQMFMTRKATALDGTGRKDDYFPDGVGYLSPAVTAEGAIQWRLSPTVSLSLGLEMWADNASVAGSNAAPASRGRTLNALGQVPAPISTPEYHLASGPQVFLLPFLGMQFGP